MKTVLILAYPLARPEIGTVAIHWDPLAIAFANWVLSVLFDRRAIAPPPGASAVFDVALVVAFGIECLFVGLAVRWLASLHIREEARSS